MTACGRTELALKFFRSLPSILSSTTDDHYDALEFTHYGQFFKIWEQLQRVVDSQAMDTPGMVRDTRKAWVREYSVRSSPSLASITVHSDIFLLRRYCKRQEGLSKSY